MENFEKYTDNQSSDKERSAVTEQLIKKKFDSAFRKELVEELATKYNVHRIPSAKLKRIRPLYWAIGVAAAILLVIGSWQFLNIGATSYHDLTNDYLAMHYPNNETRKGAENIPEQRTEAINAYNNGDFEQSAILREKISTTALVNEYDYFFLGLSYLYQNPPQSQQAIVALKKTLEFPQKEMSQEAEWYLVLAYLKAEQLAEAKELLQKRIDEQGWNSDKASELLKTLNKK